MSAGAPLVSIMVPAYNSGRFLAETLASIRQQTESRWECIVVDDGSSDDTVAVTRRFIREDPRFRIVCQQNRGASAARNAGFRASDPRTRYLTFMDADDVWLPHALATLLVRSERSPGAIGSHGLAELIDGGGELVDPGAYSQKGRERLGREGRRLVMWPLERPTGFDVLINGNVLFPPGLILAKRSAYEAAGSFDERFNGPEDWDMLIRLSRFGELEFVDNVILHYRRHGSNLGAGETIPRQAWLVRCKAFHSDENSRAQQRAAKLGWRAYQKLLIRDSLGVALLSARRAKLRAAVRELPRVAVFSARYVRGYPLPRVSSDTRSDGRGEPPWQ
jgi:glycosyltransferase involved in cell wall biosynthesis